jgi:hypothetical protein
MAMGAEGKPCAGHLWAEARPVVQSRARRGRRPSRPDRARAALRLPRCGAVGSFLGEPASGRHGRKAPAPQPASARRSSSAPSRGGPEPSLSETRRAGEAETAETRTILPSDMTALARVVPSSRTRPLPRCVGGRGRARACASPRPATRGHGLSPRRWRRGRSGRCAGCRDWHPRRTPPRTPRCLNASKNLWLRRGLI